MWLSPKFKDMPTNTSKTDLVTHNVSFVYMYINRNVKCVVLGGVPCSNFFLANNSQTQ